MKVTVSIADPSAWDLVRCPVCGNFLPCPPKGNIPLHMAWTGEECPGGNSELTGKEEWAARPAKEGGNG